MASRGRRTPKSVASAADIAKPASGQQVRAFDEDSPANVPAARQLPGALDLANHDHQHPARQFDRGAHLADGQFLDLDAQCRREVLDLEFRRQRGLRDPQLFAKRRDLLAGLGVGPGVGGLLDQAFQLVRLGARRRREKQLLDTQRRLLRAGQRGLAPVADGENMEAGGRPYRVGYLAGSQLRDRGVEFGAELSLLHPAEIAADRGGGALRELPGERLEIDALLDLFDQSSRDRQDILLLFGRIHREEYL